jgi:hypothetical protein
LLDGTAHSVPDEGFVMLRERSSFNSLVDAGLVRQDGKTVEVDPEALELLSNLIGQLSAFDENKEDPPSMSSKPEREKE